jgi:hypothetical protein
MVLGAYSKGHGENMILISTGKIKTSSHKTRFELALRNGS